MHREIHFRREELHSLHADNALNAYRERLLDFVHEFQGTSHHSLLCAELSRTIHQVLTLRPLHGALHGEAELSVALVRSRELIDEVFERWNKRYGDIEPNLSRPDQLETACYSCRNIEMKYVRNKEFSLGPISFDLLSGQITGVIGLNGSGKSTLLRIIAGEIEPVGGTREYRRLSLNNRDWFLIKNQLGFVRQRPRAWNGSIEANLILQATVHGFSEHSASEHADYYIERLGLAEHRSKRWRELSGGFQMRAELAKVMMKRPKVLILDEPLAPLDIPAQYEFLTTLRYLARSYQHPMAIILSSQHVFEVEEVADHMIVISDGEVLLNRSVGTIGYDRASDVIEISSSASMHEMRSYLKGYDADLRILSGKIFIIRIRPPNKAIELLRHLVLANVRINYYRDASNSARSSFR